jgi:hypothetical protein
MIEKQAMDAAHGKLDMHMKIAYFYLLQKIYFSEIASHVTP